VNVIVLPQDGVCKIAKAIVYGCKVIPTSIVCVEGTEGLKVREVTMQVTITLKLKVFYDKFPEKF
jgi:hypothetical protein